MGFSFLWERKLTDAGITLAQAQAQLDFWLAESLKHSHSVSGRSVSRDYKQIQDNIKYWDSMVKRLTNGGIVPVGGTPV